MTIQEARFEYKGYPCVVLFHQPGYRCGYVGLPKGMTINEDDVACYGGITYTNNRLYGQEDIDRWWIGFDCAHYLDGYDFEKAKEHFKNDEVVLQTVKSFERVIRRKWPFKTLEFCMNECKAIVEQIIKMTE